MSASLVQRGREGGREGGMERERGREGGREGGRGREGERIYRNGCNNGYTSEAMDANPPNPKP